MASHEEWLKSLTDAQLKNEVYWGGKHARMSRHGEFFKKQHEQTKAELKRRKEEKSRG